MPDEYKSDRQIAQEKEDAKARIMGTTPRTISQLCTLCRNAVQPSERYPSYLCGRCAALAVDAEGKKPWEGVQYWEGSCFVDAIPCWREEAHLGGTVVRTVESLTDEQRKDRGL
ncbi:MAG: hypothetical protein AAB737_03310 [Patescibacteria group bacterium]